MSCWRISNLHSTQHLFEWTLNFTQSSPDIKFSRPISFDTDVNRISAHNRWYIVSFFFPLALATSGGVAQTEKNTERHSKAPCCVEVWVTFTVQNKNDQFSVVEIISAFWSLISTVFIESQYLFGITLFPIDYLHENLFHYQFVQTCAAFNSLRVSRPRALNGSRPQSLGACGCWGCVCVCVGGMWLEGYPLTECLSLPAHLTERRWSPSRRPCRSSWMRQTRKPRSSRPRWDAVAATWPAMSSAYLPSNQPCHLS